MTPLPPPPCADAPGYTKVWCPWNDWSIEVEIRKEKDCKNKAKNDEVEGLASCGPEAALAAGVWTKEQFENFKLMDEGKRSYMITPVYQFRGVVPKPESGEGGMLAKGVLIVDKALKKKFIFPESCVKHNGQIGDDEDDIVFGLDIVKITDTPMTAPCLTSSMLSVLRLRIQAQIDPIRRHVLHDNLDTMVESMKPYTMNQLPRLAWHVQKELKEQPVKYDLGMTEKKEPEPLDKDRTDIGCINIRDGHDSMKETDVKDLEQGIEDKTPAAIHRGTRHMLNHGSCKWLGLRKSYKNKPRLIFPAFSACLTAISDPTYKLKENQVYVVQNGIPYVGPLTMWRYPLHNITDIVNLEAVAPPPGFVYDNCIVLSREGAINTRCAGGDLDGDSNCICFWTELVSLVEQTEEDVQRFNVDRIENEVKNLLKKQTSEFKSTVLMERFEEYAKHGTDLSTRNIRGAICSMAA